MAQALCPPDLNQQLRIGPFKAIPVTKEILAATGGLAREAYYDGGDLIAVIDSEKDLDSLRYETPERMYYPVGDLGNYVRVDLSVVLDGLVSEELLLDAFVRSANEGRKVTPEEWVAKWNGIAGIIRKDFRGIPGAEEDLARLDSLVKGGNLIMHHSPAFGAAYHPHYRIVAKDIFEAELKPLIDR